MEGECAGEKSVGAEAFAGFVEEFAEDGPGEGGRAALRWEHVAMADAFFCGDQIGDFIAAEQMPEAVAEDAVPSAVEGRFGGGAESLNGVDASGMEAHFHGAADAC